MKSGWLLAAILVAFLATACNASALSPSASRTPPSDLDPFSGLPYTMSLPTGWIGGTAESFAAKVDKFARENPELAAKVKAISPPIANVFTVGDPSVPFPIWRGCSVNTLPVPDGLTDRELLDEAEVQNRDAIAGLPGTVGMPVADRVRLTAGEAVRIRWTTKVQVGGAEEMEAVVGHSFPARGTLFTIVCVSSEADTGASAVFDALVQSFRTRP